MLTFIFGFLTGEAIGPFLVIGGIIYMIYSAIIGIYHWIMTLPSIISYPLMFVFITGSLYILKDIIFFILYIPYWILKLIMRIIKGIWKIIYTILYGLYKIVEGSYRMVAWMVHLLMGLPVMGDSYIEEQIDTSKK